VRENALQTIMLRRSRRCDVDFPKVAGTAMRGQPSRDRRSVEPRILILLLIVLLILFLIIILLLILLFFLFPGTRHDYRRAPRSHP
jgi:hypothetical protein